MSEESWIAEFYPIRAKEVPKEQALEHALQKWRGLTIAGLERHGLCKAPIIVDSSTCALCTHYYDDESDCAECPITIEDGQNCDERRSDGYERPRRNSPWVASKSGERPEPMISLLETIKEKQNV